MAIKLEEGETIEGATARWSRWARAQESWALQAAEGSIDRREADRHLRFSCWVLGQLEGMADALAIPGA